MRSAHLLTVCLFVSLAITVVSADVAADPDPSLADAEDAFAALERSRAMLVLVDGEPVIQRVVDGPDLETPVNIKSLSKVVIGALVGAAIDRDVFAGTGQPVSELLGERVPEDADARVNDITVGHLLSMQSGLARTSGANYGAWVASDDWVAYVLRREFVDEPGGRMGYSTGNSHLLSAALVEQTGESTLALARAWLGAPLEVTIPDWLQDPQGIHFGGNEMRLSPRALARFGEMIRHGGTLGGQQVLSADWIEESLTPRTRSRFNNDRYGYGWFMTELEGYTAYYGWGFGGQMLYVIPELELTAVMTSDPTPPSSGTTYLHRLEQVVSEHLIPAVAAQSSPGARASSPGP